MPSGSTNYSKTNGERRVVDNASTFIIGDGSDLKVAKVENTAAAIGTTENGKLSIDEYVGHNLENVDKLKTAGGSVGVSTSGITSIGVNYSDKKQEGITKNTVIGNVEIGKSSGDEINRDLDTMTEITEDRDFKTNVNVESQTINYIKNPEKFKEDLQKAKNEVEDLGNAVKNTSNPLGKDKRNVFENLRAQRWVTSFYNVTGSRMEELGRQFKAGTINEEDLKEALRDIVKGYGKDIGIDFDVVYLDEKTMPKDSEGSTGSAYIVDRKNRKVLIPIDVNKIEDIKKVLGTLTEEVAHGKDALEGRQDKKVAEDKSNDEEGLESLGRPTNDYFKKQYSKNDKAIELKSDGRDYSNVDFGENVGDASNPEDLKFKEYYRKDILSKDPNYKKIKFLVSMGTNMIPGVGEVKLGIEMFVGEDLLTEEKYDLIDRVQIGTSISKNISSRGINRLENQLSNSKNSQKFQLIKTELDTRNQQGQNGQQHQKGQNSVVQNNKNSINKTQPQGNQDYSGNQQVSKGATSNKQQEAPISKTSDTNKSGINQGVTNAKQKSISTNTNVKDSGVLDNGTKYVVIESSSEKIKSVDELLTKEGQAKLPNTSLKELEIIAQKEGYGTQFISDTKGSGNGQRLIITGHKSIGSIRSNSEGTHEMVYKVVSGNFKDINNNPLPGKIKVLEGKPEEYHTRGNTPEKAELIFVEKRRK